MTGFKSAAEFDRWGRGTRNGRDILGYVDPRRAALRGMLDVAPFIDLAPTVPPITRAERERRNAKRRVANRSRRINRGKR